MGMRGMGKYNNRICGLNTLQQSNLWAYYFPSAIQGSWWKAIYIIASLRGKEAHIPSLGLGVIVPS